VQIKRGKAHIFPVEPLNNFSVTFQVSVSFTYGTGVQPIPLTSTEPAADAPAVASGWGTVNYGDSELPTQLQAVELLITDRVQCNAAYADYGGITVNMICTGVPGGGKSARQGDSGGPLDVDGQLVGVVSWGLGWAEAQYRVVYSNIVNVKNCFTQESGVQ